MDGTNGSSHETLDPPPGQARTTATMTPLFVLYVLSSLLCISADKIMFYTG